MQPCISSSQRLALAPPVSPGFRSLLRTATAISCWLLVLCLSGRLWAQLSLSQRQISSRVPSQQEAPKVANFTLLNAATGQEVRPLQEGDVLDLSRLPTQLSIRANTEPSPVGSVVFGLNEQPHLRVENRVPYALAGTEPDSILLFLFQFGSSGEGEGQFNYPQGVAIDSSGNVYVADTGNNRVQKFDSTGRFLFQFGSPGSGEGQFIYPTGMVLDGSGNLYVADWGNHRIQQFDSAGHFLSQFGSKGSREGQFDNPNGLALDGSGNLYVADANNHRIQKFDFTGRFLLQFGSEGSGEGQFSFPWGVAVDGSGNLYATDYVDNNRIEKFDSTGRFLLQFGSHGTGEGQFQSPTGVALDGSGNLYVTDRYNNRIQKFDSAGRFLFKFGSPGSGEGQFYGPWGVAVDGRGHLYVSEGDNQRIQKFDSTGRYLAYSFQVGEYTLTATPYRQANGQGEHGAARTVKFRVVKSASVASFTLINAATGQAIQPLQEGDVLKLQELPGQLSVRANTDPPVVGSVVFDLNEQAPLRVDNVAPYALAGDSDDGYVPYAFQDGAYTLSATPYGQANGQGENGLPLTIHFRVEQPKVASFTLINAATGQDIQALKAGDVLDLAALPTQLSVRVNTDPWRVGSVVFDLNKQSALRVENSPPYALASHQPDTGFLFLAQFGREGSDEGQFKNPYGVVVDGSGHLYVADINNHRIQKFDSSGRFLLQFGSEGSGEGQFKNPFGLAVDGSGHLYVADGNHHIEKFDSQGHFLFQFGREGSGEGQFKNPGGLAVDGSGHLYVADAGNHRIQQYDSLGHFLFQFGREGSGEGQFKNPGSLAMDDLGNLYVADMGNHRFQRFDSQGHFLSQFSRYGTELFNNPVAIDLDGSGHLYVLANSRIQQFDSTGRLLSQLGFGGGEHRLSAVAVDSRGNLYVAEVANPRNDGSNGIYVFSRGSYRPYDFRVGDYTLTATPYQQAHGQGYQGPALRVHFKVINSAPERVVSFTLLNAATGGPVQSLKEGDVLDLATLPVQLSIRANTDPSSVGSVVFGLNEKAAIQVVNSAPYALAGSEPGGLFLAQFGGYGSDDGQFLYPNAVAVDGSNLYVVDQGNNRIQKFDSVGHFLLKFGSQGSGDGQFINPSGVTVDGFGDLYVVDGGNARIQKFDSVGHFLSQFGSEGRGQGQFLYPNVVAVDGFGNLYVSDGGNARIQKFDSSGRFLLQIGYRGFGEGQFEGWGPVGIAVDGSGNVYVAENDPGYSISRIQKFSSSGRYLSKFGGGGGPLAFDDRGNLYVADEGNNYIQKFSLDRYWPYGFQTGNYALSATPYRQPNGKAEKGLALTVNFQVVNSTSTARMSAGERAVSLEVAVYPNPFSEQVYTVLKSAISQAVEVRCYDAKGWQVGRMYEAQLEAGQAKRLEVDGRTWPDGLYFLRVSTRQQQLVKKVVLLRK